MYYSIHAIFNIIIYMSSETQMDKLFAAIAPASSVDNISLDYNGSEYLSDIYSYDGTIIGAGGYGVVIPVTDKKTMVEYAVKILNIQKYVMLGNLEGKSKGFERASLTLHVEKSLNFLKNEMKFMQDMSHPSIVKLSKVYSFSIYLDLQKPISYPDGNAKSKRIPCRVHYE